MSETVEQAFNANWIHGHHPSGIEFEMFKQGAAWAEAKNSEIRLTGIIDVEVKMMKRIGELEDEISDLKEQRCLDELFIQQTREDLDALSLAIINATGNVRARWD